MQKREKFIDNIFKIVNTKLTPVSKGYPLVSSDAPVLKFISLMMQFKFSKRYLEAEIYFNHQGNTAGGAADNNV